MESKLYTVEEVKSLINSGKELILSGHESLLSELPSGNWIGGTMLNFLTDEGGRYADEQIFVTDFSDYSTESKIINYTTDTLETITENAFDNGFTFLILPAGQPVHLSFSTDAPKYKNLFNNPLIGFVAGVKVENIGIDTAKVFDGRTQKSGSDIGVAMHVKLPETMVARVEILNIFDQSETGDDITFPNTGFEVSDCFVNGEKKNFVEYLKEKEIDTKLPIIANHSGALINVCVQNVDEENGTVSFYGPVFEGTNYKTSKPIADYSKEFSDNMPTVDGKLAFSCNCILNYLYGDLEGTKTGFVGPATFGEIAYQLLNQTMTYLVIDEY